MPYTYILDESDSDSDSWSLDSPISPKFFYKIKNFFFLLWVNLYMITDTYLHDPSPFNGPFFMTPPFSESQKVATLPLFPPPLPRANFWQVPTRKHSRIIVSRGECCFHENHRFLPPSPAQPKWKSLEDKSIITFMCLANNLTVLQFPLNSAADLYTKKIFTLYVSLYLQLLASIFRTLSRRCDNKMQGTDPVKTPYFCHIGRIKLITATWIDPDADFYSSRTKFKGKKHAFR